MFLEDKEWERTHPTWKSLIPRRDFDSQSPNDETVEQYHDRIRGRFNIPLDVITQWLYPHYYNRRMVNNYGWLDFSLVGFNVEHWSLDRLMKVYVVRDFQDYVQTRAMSSSREEFMCIPTDLDHWKNEGTWRVAPILLDARTLRNIPDYSEVVPPYQLVEGHSRLGYLTALAKFSRRTGDFIAKDHEVIIMLPNQEH